MPDLPQNPLVIFLGGPNDGFIEVGHDAMFHLLDFPPLDDHGKATGTLAALGKRVTVLMPRYALDAANKLGVDKAYAVLDRFKPGTRDGFVYELQNIEGDYYVFNYVGTVAQTQSVTEESATQRTHRELMESDDPTIWTKLA